MWCVKSSAVRISAPDGSEWVIARRWIPRWAAARLRRSLGERLRRKDRRQQRKAKGDADVRWYDFMDIPVGGDGCLDEVAVVVIAIVVIAVVWLLIVPLLVIVVDVLIAIALVIAIGVTRLLFRRPWVVEASGPNDVTIRRLVVGWRASAAEVHRLGTEIAAGSVGSPERPMTPE